MSSLVKRVLERLIPGHWSDIMISCCILHRLALGVGASHQMFWWLSLIGKEYVSEWEVKILEHVECTAQCFSAPFYSLEIFYPNISNLCLS